MYPLTELPLSCTGYCSNLHTVVDGCLSLMYKQLQCDPCDVVGGSRHIATGLALLLIADNIVLDVVVVRWLIPSNILMDCNPSIRIT